MGRTNEIQAVVLEVSIAGMNVTPTKISNGTIPGNRWNRFFSKRRETNERTPNKMISSLLKVPENSRISNGT